jgi:hypothetical protein
MAVGTGPVAHAPVLVRLPRWVAHRLWLATWRMTLRGAGEGSRPFHVRPHRTTIKCTVLPRGSSSSLLRARSADSHCCSMLR